MLAASTAACPPRAKFEHKSNSMRARSCALSTEERHER